MSITFKTPSIEINLELISKEIMQACFDELNRINREIASNRSKGIASDDTAFKDYSDSYKEAIKKGYIKFKTWSFTIISRQH